MPKNQADILICGAGIAGVSAAYYLAKSGVNNILLIDERPPLSLTSDHSSECYRNWWPDPAMLALMNHSIDLMEELADATGNPFHMNRRGYLYLTGDESKIPEITERATRISGLGAGQFRIHRSEGGDYQPAAPEGFHDQADGADLILDPALIREHFPYLTEEVVAALHVRRAGWLSAQQLGMTLLEGARKLGVRYESARVIGVAINNEKVRAVELADGRRLLTKIFINAAGPMFKEVGEMIGLDLPVFTELHLKAAFNDNLGTLERDAPLVIWDDIQKLKWTDEEREFLLEEGLDWMLDNFPSGVHIRPEGGSASQMILMLWEYQKKQIAPIWPLPLDEKYPEITLRGLSKMLPGLSKYFDHMPRPILDGGYYTKTPENRPLIGETPVEGAYLIGALSGYGIMAACGAGDLLAAQITGQMRHAYAREFSLERYDRPGYLEDILTRYDTGQL